MCLLAFAVCRLGTLWEFDCLLHIQITPLRQRDPKKQKLDPICFSTRLNTQLVFEPTRFFEANSILSAFLLAFEYARVGKDRNGKQRVGKQRVEKQRSGKQ